MAQKHWSNLLGTLILGSMAIAIELPANAQRISHNWQLAQTTSVNYNNSPTPLNLRPRVHIPLPSSSSDRYEHHYRRYNRSYDRYSDCDEKYDHGSKYPKKKRGTVIIINPSNSSGYNNYSPSIRVIRHRRN